MQFENKNDVKPRNKYEQIITSYLLKHQSIPSLTTPTRATLGDSHIPVAPGVGFSLLCPDRGGLKSKEKFDNFEKSATFALSLKQMSSSIFYMFTYARSAECNSGHIYTLTNTQHIRIYPGNLKSFLVKF